MGIPVVASRIGGVPEAVADGITGLLVQPGDVHAIAAAVIRLIDNPGLRATMSNEGPRFVARHFDWATNASLVEAMYVSLLNGNGRGHRE